MKPLTIHNTVELGREFLSLVDGNQITLKFRRRKEIFNEEFSCDFSPSLVLLLFHHKINIQTRNLRHLKSYYWIKVVLLRLRIVNLSRTGPVHPHQLINLQWQNFFTKWTRPFYYFDYFFLWWQSRRLFSDFTGRAMGSRKNVLSFEGFRTLWDPFPFPLLLKNSLNLNLLSDV